MGLPILTKTWEISANNSYGARTSTLLAYRNFWFNLISWMKSKGWTVVSASDGSVTNSTWSLETNLKWGQTGSSGNSNHSWIVLRNTAITPGFQICLDLAQNTASNLGQDLYPNSFSFYVSQSGGFSGGSSSARPTSSDEILIADCRNQNSNSIWGNNGSSPVVWHGWSSTDRECTRIAIYTAGVLTGFIMLDKPEEPSTNWSNPFYSLFLVGGGGSVTTQSGWSSQLLKSRMGSTNIDFHVSCESITGQQSFLSQKNEVSNEYPLLPLGLVSNTSNFRGKHGKIFDAWWTVPSTNGSLFPDSTTKSFSLHGGMVLPWDGTSMVKTRHK